MKGKEEFMAYFNSQVAYEVNTTSHFKLAKSYRKPVFFIFYFLVIVCATLLNKNASLHFLILFLGGFLLFGGLAWISMSNKNDVPDKLKEKTITKMLKFYAPGMKYNQGMGMIDKAIDISNIFDGNDYKTDDYMEGKLNNTYLQLCSLAAAEGNKQDQPFFTGIYMIAEFNKNFKGQYVIFSGFHIPAYADVPGEVDPVRMKEIKLENPDFNNMFCAYGTGDELETRYLLTPAMMQRMVDINNAYDEKIHFAFDRGHMFFAFETDGIPFSDELKSTRDEDVIGKWNNILHFALSLPEQFHLDEHLWSKP